MIRIVTCYFSARCFGCGKPGHQIANCWFRDRGLGAPGYRGNGPAPLRDGYRAYKKPRRKRRRHRSDSESSSESESSEDDRPPKKKKSTTLEKLGKQFLKQHVEKNAAAKKVGVRFQGFYASCMSDIGV